MPAKIIPFPTKLAPKACEWRIRYTQYLKAGVYKYEALVFNYDKGLTAFEAWEIVAFPTNPAFHECTFEQLCDYPCPNTKRELMNHHGQPTRSNRSQSQKISADIP